MNRKGISAILLVFAAAMLLMIWAAAQQFVTGTVKRRVTIAEAGRRCLIHATTAVEEGIDMLIGELNEPPDSSEEGKESLSRQFRTLAPGEVLEFAYTPRVADLPSGGVPVRLSEVRGTAFISDMTGEKGTAPSKFNCVKYKEFLIKWNSVPG